MNDSIARLWGFWQKDPGNQTLAKDLMTRIAVAGDLQASEQFFAALETHEACAQLRDTQTGHYNELRWLRAQCVLNAGQLDQAMQCFAELPEDQQFSRAYGLGLCHFFKGEFAKVHSLLQQAVSSEGTQTAVHLLWIRNCYQQGQLEQGLSHGQALLPSLLPDNPSPELFGLMAMIALDLTLLEDADKLAQMALELAPNNHDAMLAKASIYLVAQNAHLALPMAQRACELYSHSGRCWSVLGQALLLNQQPEQALDALRNATARMPQHVGTWHLQAWAAMVQGLLPEATECFNAAMELDRNFAETHGGLAVIHAHLKQNQQAEQYAKVALRLDPQCFSGRYANSLLLQEQGNTPEAQKVLQGIFEQESHLPGISHQQLIQLLGSR